MRGKNMAKNRPKCCQIAKRFDAITSEKIWLWLWKSLENLENTIICLGVNRHLVSGHEISRLQHGPQLIMARYTRIINCRPCCNLYMLNVSALLLDDALTYPRHVHRAWYVAPNSTDLNPVDYAVWVALQQTVYQRRRFTTINQLRQAIVTEWGKTVPPFHWQRHWSVASPAWHFTR